MGVAGLPEPVAGPAAGGTVVALGDPRELLGYPLAGARVIPAVGAGSVRAAWSGLAGEVALVLLTPAAAEILAGQLNAPGSPLVAVVPR